MDTLVTEKTLTLTQLQKFFDDRPAISQRAIGLEANLSDSLINKILKGTRELTQETSDKLLPILEKYGFKKV